MLENFNTYGSIFRLVYTYIFITDYDLNHSINTFKHLIVTSISRFHGLGYAVASVNYIDTDNLTVRRYN